MKKVIFVCVRVMQDTVLSDGHAHSWHVLGEMGTISEVS